MRVRSNGEIQVRIVEHESPSDIGAEFPVDPRYFTLVESSYESENDFDIATAEEFGAFVGGEVESSV